MPNISIFGAVVTIKASNTLPIGAILTQFSDDSDPIDLPDIEIAQGAMGTNGDFVTWSKPAIIPLTLSIIPEGIDDDILSILLQANRVGYGKTGAKDTITIIAVYSIGRVLTLKDGIIISGSPGLSGTSEGRFKTKTYNFQFSNYTYV